MPQVAVVVSFFAKKLVFNYFAQWFRESQHLIRKHTSSYLQLVKC